MIKAILFDLDGVICDTAILHYKAWKQTAQKLGGDIDEQFNETLKGVNRTTSLQRLLEHIDVEISNEEFECALVEKNNYYVALLAELNETNILPGIEQFIKDIKANDIKIAIASASKNAPNILEKIGLLSEVNTIANPDDVKANKPAPDIFQLAAKQLAVSEVECVGIEDSQAGIDALNSAGIKSIAIGRGLEFATIKLNSTRELTFDTLNQL